MRTGFGESSGVLIESHFLDSGNGGKRKILARFGVRAMLVSCSRLLAALAAAFLLAQPPLQAQGRKHALLIGVKGYSLTLKQFTELNTERDLEAIRTALKSKFGFQDSEILVLKTPQTTTRKAIL